ncbi:serine/threonine protein kinase [Salmonella enterica subsp. enterica serovar Caracas]|nr:serine/threonine protein kinase [Salmonella enterica subsp. enterica serovar Caracas]
MHVAHLPSSVFIFFCPVGYYPIYPKNRKNPLIPRHGWFQSGSESKKVPRIPFL